MPQIRTPVGWNHAPLLHNSRGIPLGPTGHGPGQGRTNAILHSQGRQAKAVERKWVPNSPVSFSPVHALHVHCSRMLRTIKGSASLAGRGTGMQHRRQLSVRLSQGWRELSSREVEGQQAWQAASQSGRDAGAADPSWSLSFAANCVWPWSAHIIFLGPICPSSKIKALYSVTPTQEAVAAMPTASCLRLSISHGITTFSIWRCGRTTVSS